MSHLKGISRSFLANGEVSLWM